MPGIITRSSHPDALWPGVKEWFGLQYKQWPAIYDKIFDQETSDKYQEIMVEATGFGLAVVKAEGQSISYDADTEGYKNQFNHVVYGLGYIVTREELEDNQYRQISERRAGNLAFSMRTTVETVHANVLNRAFSGSYLGGDGVSLISTSHPTLGGLQSNRLTVDADFSEAALEDMIKQMMQATNARGLKIPITPRKLIVGTAAAFDVERILNSTLRPGTANNDINAVKSMGLLRDGVIVNPYLTDPDAWFLQTDAPAGLTSFWRRRPSLERDNEFDTENLKAKSTMRFSAGWGDWRSLWGSPGA